MDTSGKTFQSILTSAQASGIVLANGNVGSFLSENSDDASVFISRNAGRTWHQAANGRHVYAVRTMYIFMSMR